MLACLYQWSYLKTKQDRLVVAMKGYVEVGTADPVAAFRSSPDTR